VNQLVAQQPGLKPACLALLQELPALAEMARLQDVSIRVTRPQRSPKHRPTLHCMFDRRPDRRRLIDWWPASGKWRTPDGKNSGVEHSAFEVLTLAVGVPHGSTPIVAAD